MSALSLDWSVAARPIAGETVSGDQHVVAAFPGGMLVGVLDGLGHGPSAQAAARAAIDVLELAPGDPVESLVNRCHRALGRFRGVVMSLASFDLATQQMTWLGVGNVEGALLRSLMRAGAPRETLLVRGGVVGQSVPALRPSCLSVGPDDVVVFATDGIDSDFVDARLLDDVRRGVALRSVADGILERHGTVRDDALVLVARCVGGGS